MQQSEKLPKISVCVATYNQERYIRECLWSVIAQDCSNPLEILVGDDLSTDGTRKIALEIAAQFPDRVLVPVREKNLGPSGNYQDLIKRATGDYIAHIDGDDYWAPEKLREQLAHFSRFPSCVAVYSNANVVGDDGRAIGVFNNSQPEVFDCRYLLHRGNFLNHSSMLYVAQHRNCLLELDEPFIDYRMHLRLSQHGPLGYVNKRLAIYRMGSVTSMTGNIPQKVDTLYWEAINDQTIATSFEGSRIAAKSHFLSRVIYKSISRKRIGYARTWLSRIYGEHRRDFVPIFVGAILYLPVILKDSVEKRLVTFFAGNKNFPRFKR